jgi:hypothetical protein
LRQQRFANPFDMTLESMGYLLQRDSLPNPNTGEV